VRGSQASPDIRPRLPSHERRERIIILQDESVGLRRLRLLEVVKLRGAEHLRGQHEFAITPAGLAVVCAPGRVSATRAHVSRARWALDECASRRSLAVTQCEAVTGPPPARGVRLEWQAVPERVRHAFEQWAGSRVLSAASQASGFSPGIAARLRLADGRGLFVKAAGPRPNAEAPTIHRREGRIVAALPRHVPVPPLRWSYDDAESGWVLLAFDEVHGRHPRQPWRLDELERVLAGLSNLAERLTPSPLPAGEVPSASEMVATRICGWQRLCSEAAGHRPALDAWSRAHLDALAELEAGAPAAVSGETLLHFDVRADNLLLDEDNVWFFDWPHACVGAAWLDVVGFAPSVAMQGGPQPEDIFARSSGAHMADPGAVTAGLAAVAGYFTYQALQPPPPGLPTVRAFQSAQGVIARQWLARRTGWTA
jgi:Phosphotransferase enzyme family